MKIHFEVYKRIFGGWRWRLRAANGKVIATSGEGYTNRADCLAGIALVQSTNAKTKVEGI